MIKHITRILGVILATGIFAGCATQPASAPASVASQQQDTNTETIKIVSTIFPVHNWVQQLVGEDESNAELTLLLNGNTDMHSYQFTVDDIITISNCDMLIYVGGESDAWIEEAIKIASNQDLVVVNLLDILGDAVKEELIIEGMEHDHDEDDHEDHDHDDEEEHDDHDHDEITFDEHIWLSLKHAQTICSHLAEELIKLDPANAAVYEKNAIEYTGKIAKLDEKYQALVNSSPVKTLVFADRFPFRYLADDYGIDYYAAFPGCSAETEASFETIIFLATKLDELQLKNIMVIESADQSIARTVSQNSKVKEHEILVLNSLQSLTPNDISAGASYLSIMEDNLSVLEKALN